MSRLPCTFREKLYVARGFTLKFLRWLRVVVVVALDSTTFCSERSTSSVSVRSLRNRRRLPKIEMPFGAEKLYLAVPRYPLLVPSDREVENVANDSSRSRLRLCAIVVFTPDFQVAVHDRSGLNSVRVPSLSYQGSSGGCGSVIGGSRPDRVRSRR